MLKHSQANGHPWMMEATKRIIGGKIAAEEGERAARGEVEDFNGRGTENSSPQGMGGQYGHERSSVHIVVCIR